MLLLLLTGGLHFAPGDGVRSRGHRLAPNQRIHPRVKFLLELVFLVVLRGLASISLALVHLEGRVPLGVAWLLRLRLLLLHLLRSLLLLSVVSRLLLALDVKHGHLQVLSHLLILCASCQDDGGALVLSVLSLLGSG